jgi:uncharacterized protein (DUF305 family)
MLFCVAFSATLQNARADEPAPRQSEAKFEVKFMQNMIDHHMMAVMTAELCEDRAVHEELLALCDQIMLTQSAEIAEMQTWLEDWYGITYEPEMTRQMERQLDELAELDGEEFEIAFMEMMIKHHSQAIKEGRKCTRKAYHEELITLCENIIAAQQEEIVLMQTWLCEWYDRCQ